MHRAPPRKQESTTHPDDGTYDLKHQLNCHIQQYAQVEDPERDLARSTI